MRAVIAHESNECAVVLAYEAGLNVAEAEQRLAGSPGRPAVIGDRHD